MTMTKEQFLLSVCATLFALCPTVDVQSVNLPRIGYLSASSSSEAAPRTSAFRQGLRNLGYVEGKILSLISVMQTEISTAFQLSSPTWFVLKVDIILYGWPFPNRPSQESDDYNPHRHDQR